MFAVVTFIPNAENPSDEVYTSEIPLNWLDNGNKTCWWPTNNKNIGSLIAKRVEPDINTWVQEQVIVEVLGVTLEKARKKAQDSEYTSSEELYVGRGKRKIFPKRINSPTTSSDECESNKGLLRIQAPPNLPDSRQFMQVQVMQSPGPSTVIHKNKDTEFNKEQETNQNNLSELSIDITKLPVIFETETNEQVVWGSEIAGSHIPTSTSNTNIILNTEANLIKVVDEHFKKINRMFAVISLKIDNISHRLNAIETNKTHISNDDTNFEVITNFLPLQNINQIEEFDDLLKSSKDAALLFKTYISTVGGNCPKDNVNRIWKKTFVNECAMKCSWLGQRNNFKVAALTMTKLIIEVILSSCSAKESDVEQLSKEWFRLAKQRHQRELKLKLS